MVQRESFGAAGKEVPARRRIPSRDRNSASSPWSTADTIWMLDPCQDHKQVGEGDTGPNTGGMGAYCPHSSLE